MNFILSKVTEVGVIFLITSILLSTDPIPTSPIRFNNSIKSFSFPIKMNYIYFEYWPSICLKAQLFIKALGLRYNVLR